MPERRRRLETRTKIVATLGPACRSLTKVRDLVRAGGDVLRINAAHGTRDEHRQFIRWAKRVRKAEGRPVGILVDLQGPKIRVGLLANAEPFLLRRRDRLVIVADPDFVGEPGRIGCSYRDLPRDLEVGDRMLVDDGSLELRVERVRGDEVVTRVRYGGLLRQGKGINLPGTRVRAPSLGPKDIADLEFALSEGVDFIALSFVRSAGDIKKLRARMRSADSAAEIIAKIERPEAVKDIAAIVRATDGVMIARGDMGVELGPEAVPGIQKRIIRLCIEHAKPVITATQMLESMIESPRPTRAEASDVANAIHDGSSALMLSAETAAGKYALLAVKTMDRIARRTESELFGSESAPRTRRLGDVHRYRRSESLSITEASVSAAARAAVEADARVLGVVTETGRTAKLAARERLATRMIAFTPDAGTYHRLALQWGVTPLLVKRARSIEPMFEACEREVKAQGHARPGDRLVFVAGSVQVAGATNTVTIRELS